MVSGVNVAKAPEALDFGTKGTNVPDGLDRGGGTEAAGVKAPDGLDRGGGTEGAGVKVAKAPEALDRGGGIAGGVKVAKAPDDPDFGGAPGVNVACEPDLVGIGGTVSSGTPPVGTGVGVFGKGGGEVSPEGELLGGREPPSGTVGLRAFSELTSLEAPGLRSVSGGVTPRAATAGVSGGVIARDIEGELT